MLAAALSFDVPDEVARRHGMLEEELQRGTFDGELHVLLTNYHRWLDAVNGILTNYHRRALNVRAMGIATSLHRRQLRILRR